MNKWELRGWLLIIVGLLGKVADMKPMWVNALFVICGYYCAVIAFVSWAEATFGRKKSDRPAPDERSA